MELYESVKNGNREFSKIPVVDFPRIENLFKGKHDFLQKIINALSVATPENLDKLRVAIITENTDECKKAAHTIKGSLANIGGERSSGIARCIEYAARDNDIDLVKELFVILEKEAPLFIEDLKKSNVLP